MRAFSALGLVLVVSMLYAGAAGATLTEVTQFGSYGSGDGQMISPAGVAANPITGSVYVVDQGNQRIDEFDSQGNFLMAFGWGVADGASRFETCTSNCQSGSYGSGAGGFAQPSGVAIDRNTGNVYVVDTNNLRVEEFDPNGNFILTFGQGVDQTTGGDVCTAASGDTCGAGSGGDGTGAGFATLTGAIAVNATGEVYVADWGAGNPSSGASGFSRIAVFTSGGDYEPGRDITSAPGGVQPLSLSFDTNGNLYDADGSATDENQPVKEFDSTGAYVRSLPALSSATVAVDTSTNHVLVGENHLGSLFDFREYDPSGNLVSQFGSGAVSPASTGSAWNPVPTTADQNGFSFTQGDLLATDPGNGDVAVFARPIPQLPSVDDNWVTNVSSASADIHSQINPNFGSTSYYVQYGPTTAYGNTSPAPPGQFVGDQVGDQSVIAHLSGLSSATTYHYRIVATNSAGTTDGPDRTFTTYLPATAFTLPDGRAYEQVSPVAKDSSDIAYNADTVSAPDGNSVVFGSSGSFAGCPVGGFPCEYVGSRGSTNWSTVSISAPKTADHPEQVLGVSSDFTKQLVMTGSVLAPGGVAGNLNMYIHDSATATYTFVASGPANSQGTFNPHFMGASPNFDRVYFMVDSQAGQPPQTMTPASVPATTTAITGSSGVISEIYDYSGGIIHLDGVLPDGSVDPNGAFNPSNEARWSYRHVVSTDGSTVFWGDDTTGVLYATTDDTNTVALTTPQGGPNGTTPQAGEFGLALADGSKVYFTSSSQLTANASPTAPASAGDLYQYDRNTGVLTDLTPDPTEAAGADVQAVVGAGDSPTGGTYAYFVAFGALADGAKSGQPNLYVWHDTGSSQSITLVTANLTGADLTNSGQAPNFRISANGRYLGFYSSASLTGYDNRDINTGSADNEAYLYDANAGTLTCASCLPTGERPSGSVSLHAASAYGTLGDVSTARSVSDSGQFFFDSPDSLVSADTNGMQDVYEYESGRIYLLSTGRSDSNSYFGDASPSGNDVFFLTRQRLVGQDQDNAYDLYDARVGGGLPAQNPTAPVSCDGDACQDPYGSAPAFGSPGSASYSGPANVKTSVHVLRIRRLAHAVKVTVWTSGAGRVLLSGRYLHRTQVRVRRAGTHVIRVRLTGRRGRGRYGPNQSVTRLRVRYRNASGVASASLAMRIAGR